jgi:hypothetical protein
MLNCAFRTFKRGEPLAVTQSKWLRPSDDPWANGLRLTLLNAVLALFSMISFLGILMGVSAFNQYQQALGQSPSSEIPFPFAVLLLIDTVLLLTAWVWFGRRLPIAGRARWVASLVGAGSLFVVSAMVYLGAIIAMIWGAFDPERVPVASVVVLGGIATLILLAGIACVALTYWSHRPTPRASD